MKASQKRQLAALLLCCTALLSCAEQSSETAETVPPAESAVTAPPADNPYEAAGMRFSAKSGFYAGAFSLSITAENGAEIYYTLDGSEPTAQSTRYTAPIVVKDRSDEPDVLSAHTEISPAGGDYTAYPPKSPSDKATVVRAVSVDRNGTQSPVVTNTYFVGFDQKAAFYREMKILSLVTDERNLFDPETGIYVLGKVHENWKNSADRDPETPEYFMPANYTQKGRDWERGAVLQIFENGEELLSQNAGIRIHGGATRSYPQKSLNLYARKVYGASKFSCDLFSGAVTAEAGGGTVKNFDSFMLRNGGNDAQFSRIRDRLNQSLAAGRAFLTQGMTPCILFINGEFWGQYDITEKADADFIEAHCGIPKEDVCIIKKEALDAGPIELFEVWEQLRDWIRQTDFSDDAAYDRLCAQIDMQSFADYVSAEVYINNANWDSSNMAMWMSDAVQEGNHFADGKWRFIMFDTDFSAGLYGTVRALDNSFRKLTESGCFLGDLFKAALKNDRFRKQFSETFTEIASVNFAPETVHAKIDALEQAYREPAAATFQRFWSEWPGGPGAEKHFAEQVQSVREFYDARGAYMMQYLAELTEAGSPN